MQSSRIRECQFCGKPYELCMGCDQSNFFSWKQVACSIECYQEIEKIAMNLNETKEVIVNETIEEVQEIVVDTKAKK
jgi:hypothetical protein